VSYTAGGVAVLNRFQSFSVSGWAWRGVIACISRPKIWVPFLVVSGLQVAILLLLINFHRSPILPLGLPLVRLLGGENVTHYPYFFFALPVMFFRANIVINILIASIAGAVASIYFAKAYGYGDDRGAWGRALRASPSLIAIAIVTVGILYAISWLSSQIPDTDFFQGAVGRWGLRLVLIALFVIVQSFLAYTTAWVALIGHKFWPAIRDSVRITSKTFLPTIIAIGVPTLFLYPLSYATGRIDIILENLNPEIMVTLLVLQIVCQILVTVLLVGAVTRLFLWRVEATK